MNALRSPATDPRTIARDIPGILDALFPHLVPTMVAHFNRMGQPGTTAGPVPSEVIDASALQHAMLFEIAVAIAEQMLSGASSIDWDAGLELAGQRQRRHFDAKVPGYLTDQDKIASEAVAINLVHILQALHSEARHEALIASPVIPGFQWIASGLGDFALGTKLIEVKCTSKHFSSSDYRQILMYWLLSYSASVETGSPEWTVGILLNPRSNVVVQLPFDELISVVGAGRSKLDLLEVFTAMVSSRDPRH